MTPGDDDLRRALARLQTAHRIAGLGSWEAELRDPPVLYWSPETYEIAGWPADEPPSFEGFVRLVHPDDRPAFLDARSAALAGDRPYAIDVRIVRHDGALRHLHVAARILRDDDGTPRRLIGAVQDRTAELEDLRQLRTTEAARRELLQRVIDSADIERSRLARHLASGPLDQLAAVAHRLDAFLGTGQAPGWTDALDAVRRSITSLDETLSAIETTVQARDLVDMVDELVDDVAPDLEVTAEVAPGLALRPAVQATVVRVLQEALHNVRKHADASSASVRLGTDGGVVHLVVADDGRGFDTEASTSVPGHLGLVSMRDRVDALGGELEIRSRPGRTVVAVRLPLSSEPQRLSRS